MHAWFSATLHRIHCLAFCHARFSIRPETAADVDAIDRITCAAFQHHPHSDQTEHLIIARLRARRSAHAVAGGRAGWAGDRSCGLFAGHFFGRRAGWYGLGPIAVAPRHQGQGVGSALVQQGLELLRARGAAGCLVLGEPAYYGRFGFAHRAECVFRRPCACFQVLAFGNSKASGEVAYHAAFGPH
jgi:putative acetyltransferase